MRQREGWGCRCLASLAARFAVLREEGAGPSGVARPARETAWFFEAPFREPASKRRAASFIACISCGAVCLLAALFFGAPRGAGTPHPGHGGGGVAGRLGLRGHGLDRRLGRAEPTRPTWRTDKPGPSRVCFVPGGRRGRLPPKVHAAFESLSAFMEGSGRLAFVDILPDFSGTCLVQFGLVVFFKLPIWRQLYSAALLCDQSAVRCLTTRHP